MPAQEVLTMFITHAGVTTNVGSSLDSLAVWIETKKIDLGYADRAKHLDQIVVHLTDRAGHTTFNLEIYGADDEDGPYELLQTLAVSGSDPLNPRVAAKRFFYFRFVDSTVSSRWRLHKVEFYGELLGDEF